MANDVHDPASVGEIDRAVVVRLTGRGSGFKSGPHQEWACEREVELTGDAVARVVDLWKQLPDAVQMRCHLPGYGLRLYRADAVELAAAVCFQCNNISILRPHGDEWRKFDAQSEPGQALLAMFREAFS